MINGQFIPEWQTPSGNLTTTLSQGSVVNIQLAAGDKLELFFDFTPTLQVLLKGPAEITSVSVNNINLDLSSLTLQGRLLTIDLSSVSLLPSNNFLILEANTNLSYSLLYGSLPPGLSINSSGLIYGTVADITNINQYMFAVRATNGSSFKDNTFVLEANTTIVSTYFINLPSFETDDTLNIDYYSFGYYQLLDFVNVVISSSSNSTPNSFVLLSTGLSGAFIEGLPLGISLASTGLYGTVNPSAMPGRYLFKLGFATQTSPTIFGQLIVEDTLALYESTVPLSIVWETPSGSLGIVKELSVSTLSFSAASSTPVYYQLAPNSGPLPSNIRISSDGHLIGEFGHVDNDMLYEFTIRATDQLGNYADRSFSITVLNVYDSSNVLDIRLHLRSVDSFGLTEFYTNFISSELLYRPSDANFGIPYKPFIYYIKGLNSANLEQYINDVYQSYFEVLMGPHTWAIARDDNGIPIYEAIYRPLIDPQALAGGFEFNTDYSVPQPVYDETDNFFVYPRSIRNGRMDFINNLQFATENTNQQFLSGMNGVEMLPAWMTSQQTVGDDSSILGFIPAIVVAYVLPGNASSIIKLLNDGPPIPNGRKVVFDHYEFIYANGVLISTTWDNDQTTFDENQTIFDLS